MPFIRPNPQRVPTTSVIENSNGKAYHPVQATNGLSPSAGSIQQSPPNVTRLIGIDFQTTTFSLTAGAGATTFVTWPSMGFPGILAADQRFYNSGVAPPLTTAVPTGLNALVTGQTTQLCLLCTLQSYSSQTTNIFLSAVSIATQGSTASPARTLLQGPWLSSGTTYTAFSCTASAGIITPTAVSGLQVSLGISAQLYAVYIQN